MTQIYEILEAIKANTNHIVVMTPSEDESRIIVNELRTAQTFAGHGRVFFKDNTRISIITAGDTYDEGVTDYSLLHWAWYNQPEANKMKKAQQWEAKAKEILTK
jgi:hypothetical protein